MVKVPINMPTNKTITAQTSSEIPKPFHPTLTRSTVALAIVATVIHPKYTLKGSYSRKWIREARAAGIDGLNFRYRGLSKDYVKKAHREGLKMYAWTVDDTEEAKKLIEAGIDGITTNRLAWLREQLSDTDQ